MQIWLCSIFLNISQRQITFLGPLEVKDKVFNCEKLVFKSGVWLLFLFALTDAILLKLDLQKNDIAFGQSSKWKLVCVTKMHHTSKNPKIGEVLFFSYYWQHRAVWACEWPGSWFPTFSLFWPREDQLINLQTKI